VLDVFSRLHCIGPYHILGEGTNDYVANIVNCSVVFFLESTDRARDIQMYINSPGGSVYAGLGIYDTMQFIGPAVINHLYRYAAPQARLDVRRGKRTALKHSRVMMHQPSGGIMARQRYTG